MWPGSQAGQWMHVPGCSWCLYMPNGHSTHAPARSSPQKARYEPAGHASHGVHGVSHSPVTFLNELVAHAAQLPPKTRPVPPTGSRRLWAGGHGAIASHVAFHSPCAALKVPSGQASQLPASLPLQPTRDCPAGQGTQGWHGRCHSAASSPAWEGACVCMRTRMVMHVCARVCMHVSACSPASGREDGARLSGNPKPHAKSNPTQA